ncbi:MAG: terminase small subunit, partial [Betaproteobacteria bacterium]
ATQAAISAGYSPNRANSSAHRLLRDARIKAAVDAIRAEVAERAGYTVERCMTELEKGMNFALSTENASAYVRAVELRAKLAGILVDKVDLRAAIGVFQINVHGLTDRSD